VASEPQPLDAIPLIRRKRVGEGDQETPEANPSPTPEMQAAPPMRAEEAPETAAGLRMKPRETVQLAAVHVRIPEQLARGLRLMSVLEGRQAQVIVAEMLEEHLTRWNPRWRETVPAREG
jgi:hypothetical protein